MQHFGIIANPVSHSLSPAIYTAAFQKYNIDATFEPILLREEELPAFIEAMREGEKYGDFGYAFDGVAVSHPFKEPCLHLVDMVDTVAQEIGAVNTIARSTDGKLMSFNTDWCGVQASVDVALAQSRKNLTSLKWKKVLVLGAGGIARASVYAFSRAGAHVYICNRTEEKGRGLAEKFGAEFVAPDVFQGYEDSPEIFDVVFQGTSLGMNSDTSALLISFWEHHGNGMAIESIYHPKMTRFLREADRAGWDIITADHLFVGQAVEQFGLLTGKSVDSTSLKNLFYEIISSL